MTDTTSLLNTIIGAVNSFNNNLETFKSLSDRIGADSGLSAALAAKSPSVGRSDLTTADFDNLKAAIDALVSLLNDVGSSHSVNTATVKLAFYKVI